MDIPRRASVLNHKFVGHRDEDYPGTGIGPATVSRIIRGELDSRLDRCHSFANPAGKIPTARQAKDNAKIVMDRSDVPFSLSHPKGDSLDQGIFS
jgi:hypothetical protein